MKRVLFLSSLLAASFAPAAHALDVGVSIAISQPGVYGRVDIGPQPPAVLYLQPVVIAQPVAYARPVYMWVPPGHAKNWGKHCHRYNACAVPVYFVRDDPYGGGHPHKHKHKHRD